MGQTSGEIDLNCCGDTPATNPKKDVFNRREHQTGLPIYTTKNPIEAEVEDADDLKKFFQTWNFVPYAGTTKHSGQTLQALYLLLYKLSDTHNASIKKKLIYAVGGKGAFVRSEDPEWEIGEESKPLTKAEKVAFRDAINQYVTFENGIGEFCRRLGTTYETTGDGWMEVCFTETLGVPHVVFKTHRVTHVLYVNTKPGEARMVGISPVWTDRYLQDHEPRYVPMYPNFVKDKDGVYRTMFHLKYGDNTWYGRPPSEGSDLYKYREVQDALYLIKQAAGNFTGQLIIEVEDDDPDFAPAVENDKSDAAGYDGFTDRFEKNFTNRAEKPQSVLVVSRPYGSKPMFAFQVKPNTNENWYKETGHIAENKIIRSHGCTPRFMGFEVSNSLGSGETFVSDYVMNMEPVINQMRDTITKFVNKALSVAWNELLKMPEMNDISITFMPPIQSQLDNYKTSQTPVVPDQQTKNATNNSV